MEQKSRLAYEKGHLTSQVTQLQGELESMAKQHADLVKYRQTAAALDAKCSKVCIIYDTIASTLSLA